MRIAKSIDSYSEEIKMNWTRKYAIICNYIYTLPVLTTLEILLPNFVSFELWNISKKINKSEWPTYSQDGIWFEKMSNDWLKS